ncbi:hypothetical protein [Pseudomonas phage Nerthus]|uniref:Uncharacterized protein n=1 Tax=Pseudomonas phage Nerthus TaxID=2163984 RepID=A0A2S1GMS2_9CAUD|nr:hypothetical protein HOT09_gp42 [Pseudomonas phage Nerthus]AWD90674.1 hypothetical protein [Pseudomonas phage Nerthus]
MAQAKVTGEYPKESQTPALTQPFAKSVKGAPITVADLQDPQHPINISNISGKTRGGTVLLDNDSVWMALGHRAVDGWQEVGAGGVKTVNGRGPDENGDVTLVIPAGTVTSVNGVEPDEEGAVALNVIKTVNGAGPDASGNINVSNKQELTYYSQTELTIDDASDGKLYVLNGTDQQVTFGAVTKTIQCSFVGTGAIAVTQGTATQFITEGDWAASVPAGRIVKLTNNGNLWVMDRPAAP